MPQCRFGKNIFLPQLNRAVIQCQGRKQDETEFTYSYDELSTVDVDDSVNEDEPVEEPRTSSNYFMEAISLVAEGNRCVTHVWLESKSAEIHFRSRLHPYFEHLRRLIIPVSLRLISCNMT